MPASSQSSLRPALARRPLALLATGVATVVLALLDRCDAVPAADEPEE